MTGEAVGTADTARRTLQVQASAHSTPAHMAHNGSTPRTRRAARRWQSAHHTADTVARATCCAAARAAPGLPGQAMNRCA